MAAIMIFGPQRVVASLAIFVLFLLVWTYQRLPDLGSVTCAVSKNRDESSSHRQDPLDFSIPIRFKSGTEHPPGQNYTRKIVVPWLPRRDITTWLDYNFKDELILYDVEDRGCKHCVPKNKGNEAMVESH
jgi:hypothetical protein